MRKILHMASHLINIGDGAIHYGTRKYFSEIENGTRFVNLDVVTFDLNRQLVDLSGIDEGQFDMLLVGGGGSIDGFRNKPCGIAMPLKLGTLKEIKTPMLFWALGENLFRGQGWHEDAKDSLNALIAICRDRGWPFTVRADGSLARLESALEQSNHDYIVELPDPGFFIEADQDFSPSVFERDYVIVQLASDNYHARIGDKEKANEFFADMAKYVDWLYDKGLAVIFALHTHVDVAAVSKAYEFMDKKAMRLGTMVTGMWNLMDSHKFFRYYDKASLVVGMRGHAVICGTGLGVPTIAIDTHPKVGGFMKEIGMSDYSIDPHNPDFLYNLKEVTADILFKSNYDPSTINSKGAQWDNDLRSFLHNYLEK